MTDDDQLLLQRFYQKGDDCALARFVKRHRAWAIAKATRYFAEEAEDIVQLSILRLMDCEPVNGEVRNPLGLWSTIIGATAMDQLRSHLRRRERESDAVQQTEDKVMELSVELEHKQLLQAILAEIESLDEVFKKPFIKRYFEGMSYEDIARAMDSTTGTVGSRLSRTIKRIRSGLVAKGIIEE